MTTRIRLARGGKKKVPYYKVIVADSRSPRDGAFIELVGTYNPLLAKDDPKRFAVKTDRVEYWLDKGAVPSEVVAKFLCKLQIKGAERYKPVFIAKPKKVAEAPKEEVSKEETAVAETSVEEMSPVASGEESQADATKTDN